MTAFQWDLEHRSKLFDEIPSGVFVVDRSLDIVDHNRAFGELFGPSCGQHCYEVLKGRDEPCPVCAAEETFIDGKERVLEQKGVDKRGLAVDCLVQLSPIRNGSPNVEFVAAMPVR